MNEVVHFGLSDLAYSSYLLQGLRDQARAGRIRFSVLRRLPDDLRTASAGHENMQMISLFEARSENGKKAVRFCVDNHDRPGFVHPGLIAAVDHYFKGNHDPDAIAAIGLEPALAARVRPLGAPFAPLRLPLWTHRPALRPVPELRWGRRDVARRVRQLVQLPSLAFLRSLRAVPKTHDVTFSLRLYRQAHHSEINEFRVEVGRRLLEHPDIDADVSFMGRSSGWVQKLLSSKPSPRQYLARLASSRVGVYVWGAHRCLSFKLCEQLAVGLPVIGQPIPQDRAHLAGLDGFDRQFRYDDPVKLVEAVAEALENRKWLESTAASNAALFDRQLAPEVCAGNVLDTVFGAD